MRTVRVFLSMRSVARTVKPGEPKPTNPVRYKARWIARGTGSELYVSKVCDTEEEAKALAHKWLKRTNEQPYPVHIERTTYLDTTEHAS